MSSWADEVFTWIMSSTRREKKSGCLEPEGLGVVLSGLPSDFTVVTSGVPACTFGDCEINQIYKNWNIFE
jgi:hypothetical protein